MCFEREPDAFDEMVWLRRLADDKAWTAMLAAGTPLTESEYETLPGNEYSTIPFGKMGFVKSRNGKPFAYASQDRTIFRQVDRDIYVKVFDDEMRKNGAL